MSRSFRNNPEAKKAAAKRTEQCKVRRSSRRGSPEYTLEDPVVHDRGFGYRHGELILRYDLPDPWGEYGHL